MLSRIHLFGRQPAENVEYSCMSELDQDEQGRDSLTGLARKLGRLPAEKRRAAFDVSAAIAGVSLKAGREFVESVPRAAKLLSADEIRDWGELGRRLAMSNADLGVDFLSRAAEQLKDIPSEARRAVFLICSRQLVLSSSVATATFDSMPDLASRIADPDLLERSILLASEVAKRSAKHSSDLLAAAPATADAICGFGPEAGPVADAAFMLAQEFVDRTGGMAADMWADLPVVLEGITADRAVTLLASAVEFLEYGGSVTLAYLAAGNRALRVSPANLGSWSSLARKIATSGNAVLIAFLRATPRFFAYVASARGRIDDLGIRRLIDSVGSIASVDAESALAAFRSIPEAMGQATVVQFESWAEHGLEDPESTSQRARRSYFGLETKASNATLSRTSSGLTLESIRTVIRMYVEALTGREIEVSPISELQHGSRIGDGRTVYLPASVTEFEDEPENFRLYKVLAAHGAGQIEFGTFAIDTDGLKAAYASLSAVYAADAEQTDAFSLAGYIEDISAGTRGLSEAEAAAEWEKREAILPLGSDHRAVLAVFPEPRLARRIFGTLENARIDARLRDAYRGLRRDLDLMRDLMRRNRPYIFDVPMAQVPFELLFQVTMCGGAGDESRQFYGQIVSEIETVVDSYLKRNDASVSDTLMATSRIYSLFQNVSPEQIDNAPTDEQETGDEFVYQDADSSEAVTEDQIKREARERQQDVSELFSAWNDPNDESEPDELSGGETWTHSDMPEQPLEPGDEAFAYDEWDRELHDHRVGWSRVIEKRVKQGDRTFVELTRSRYRGVISSIRHQFQMMKPENLVRVNREIDGEDYDLNALVDLVIDRRADGRQSENIYTKRLRKQRDVAVSLLLDQSSSTARTITRNPLQPYTHPGRRIIEIEKEGLVLMSEALEAVGDVYSINGFTSEGRRNVKFYVVKDFAERYDDTVERRIGGITFQNNTRLGAAIRHATHKLARLENRTKLLIILTDGRPYDHDYGDARYAREDVREALIESKIKGITPFCITIDRESEAELKDLYGDVGYTIIDDVLSLPERIPNIYRRLTS